MSRKKHIFKRQPKQSEPVKVTPKLLDKGLPNRVGHQTPKYIIIHEVSLGTGRSPNNFNMEYYEKKIKEDAQNGSDIGYHYLVGDTEIYQFLEDDVATCHTGTDFGNANSIGIERLICEGVNYEYAIHNQAELAATLMLKYNIPIENVITHKEVQKRYGDPEQQVKPKQCPGRLLSGFRGTMQDFNNEIKRCFVYGWFFEELLDEKTIEQIPQIQEISQKRFATKKDKTQRIKTHGLPDNHNCSAQNIER